MKKTCLQPVVVCQVGTTHNYWVVHTVFCWECRYMLPYLVNSLSAFNYLLAPTFLKHKQGCGIIIIILIVLIIINVICY